MPVLERLKFPLNIENLPSGLTAVATPQKITVKVGKKVKRDGMIVVPQVDQSQIDSKLQIDSVTVSNERVSVTTDQETLAKIDKVIALLPTSERIPVITVAQYLDRQSTAMVLSYRQLSLRSTQQ